MTQLNDLQQLTSQQLLDCIESRQSVGQLVEPAPTQAELKHTAIDLLSRRDHSCHELKQKLQQRIYEETDGLYKLTWRKLEVDEVKKRLRFVDLRLETDSSFSNGTTTKDGRSLPFIVLHIPTLEINGYKIDKKEKTMTNTYHLRSAVAAIFATGLTYLFALTTVTGQAGLAGVAEKCAAKA